ncbi:hypothetical protein ITJ44_08400 [Clavibacter sp. VKM Ac-2873]|uniref:hypothetical protein n=1 Tax=Clavibacter sp. VKM Ac-2873 TaxID=2783813 RepID=UPI00188CB839|nr:hypothetical protein [Clavibacter sp. VKM Ac-2873]MBF4618092.1 hypothetical protein [Clavibacter sp. VKM Ac-2873]
MTITRSTARRLGSVGATAALIAVGLAVPTAANAAPTECEPGTVSTTLTKDSSNRVVAGSQTSTATTGGPLSATVSADVTRGSTVSAGASIGPLMGAITLQVSATATESASWSAGSTLGPVDVPAGGTLTATYGFEDISWSGTTTTCMNDGQLGTPQTVSGTVQGATWVDYAVG